jgi:hypothetical protein
VRHDIGAHDLAPGLQLLDSGGTERISGGDNDALALFAVRLRQLGHARRLARAIDSDDEYDRGTIRRRRVLLAPDASLLSAYLERSDEFVLQNVAHVGGIGDALAFDAELHVAEDFLRCRDARVGADQQFFKVLPDLVVDLAACEQA